ncbi:PglL family O-oligosaccharyltransferase [Psychrobacter pulmonis]|uniref:PglL family O-oligosaccharyltransferase n=1 Tax=Psychrobacter pulmonis TaxID=228654 RepID=UPI00191AEDA1|nr:Wzy polymerase domain-containing protein [Psychrobacter pulmonis]
MKPIDHNRHWSVSAMLACITLLLIVPFAISGHYAVYSSLYQDFVVVALCIMVVLLATITKSLRTSAPRVSYVLLAMAGYWLLQPLLADVIYNESNIKAAILFVLFAAMAWSIHAIIDRSQLISVIAWSLLIGASIQAVVVVMQAIGLEVTILGVFNVSADNGMQGQLGQRNLLAHYLCWGIVAGSYLSIRGIRDNKFYYLSAVFTILLAVVLGLVGSRSIVLFGIAMTVMALLQILCYRQLTVTSKWLIATSALILIPQVLLPAILSSFDTATQTGLQRVLSSGTDTARGYELKKALLGFMQAPIFGQGWNESTFQAFSRALDIMPLDLHQQEKLPEHSHNIISELLVEMGVVGTLIVVVGTIWALIPAIKTSLKLENVFILALLTITAIHSMVEYPLWNTFFLMAVVLFLTTIPNQRFESPKRYAGSLYQLPILIISLASLAVVCFFMFIYQNNYRLYAVNATSEEEQYNARANAFYSVFLKLPLFREDEDKLIVQNIDIMADSLSDDQVAALLRYSEYKPTPQSSQYRGLYEYKVGHKEAGLDWLQRSWHFYPSQLGQSLVFIYNAHPTLKGLENKVYNACLRYQITNFYNNLKSCPTPPSTW